jgi:beta-galactosidase
MELTTAGPPAQIELTPIARPQGLQADGEDAALIGVDAKGQRCPTGDARVDFAVPGPGVWRGGFNSGKIDSTNNLYLSSFGTGAPPPRDGSLLRRQISP